MKIAKKPAQCLMLVVVSYKNTDGIDLQDTLLIMILSPLKQLLKIGKKSVLLKKIKYIQKIILQFLDILQTILIEIKNL